MDDIVKPLPGSVEDLLLRDPSKLTRPIKDIKEKYELLPAFLKTRGLVKQHIESFNYFMDRELKKIVTAKANEKVTATSDPACFLQYTNAFVGVPSTRDEFGPQINPQLCRLRDQTYNAPIYCDVRYRNGQRDTQIHTKRGLPGGQGPVAAIKIGYLPLMLRSNRCVLNGKTEEELAKLGECPLDPGGYFVVKGTEKVILIQEQLSKNRIIVDVDGHGQITASVTSSTHERKSKTNLVLKAGVIKLRHNAFTDDLNIMIVFKAMGMASDQEIMHLIGADSTFTQLLLPSVQDCRKEGVTTPAQALQFLAKHVTSRQIPKQSTQAKRKSREDDARDILANVVVCHVAAPGYDFADKVLYIAMMVRRMLYAMGNPKYIDDRDYYGNKRLELAGGQIAILFEDLFKRFNNEIKRSVDLSLSRAGKSGQMHDLTKMLPVALITQGLESAISSGNWHISRFRMDRKGVTQVLNRLSFIAVLGMMTRISSQFEKTRKVSGPRALQPSQLGMVCPADTPEGESCGLVKNLAMMTHVTTDEDEKRLLDLIYALGTHPASTLSPHDLHRKGHALVMLNGTILGVHARPKRLLRTLRQLRRAGYVGEFVSVHRGMDILSIACDGGRVCRPLIICDRGVPRLTPDHVAKMKTGEWDFNDLLRRGIVEYLDVNEENDVRVAMYEENCSPDVTHLEIEPFTFLGVVAGLIPFPHHNQSPRNTYQCAMGKQAMGNIAYNQLNRSDTLLYLLVYPQRPLLSTKTIELVGFDKLGAGQNATVAVMSYSGYDIEDAIVLNKASLDRGFGRCVVLRRQGHSFKKKNGDFVVDPFRKDEKGNEIDRKLDKRERWRAIEDDGMAAVGDWINSGDFVINRAVPKIPLSSKDTTPKWDEETYKDVPVSWKGPPGEPCIVERVLLTSNDEFHLIVKVMIRHTRRPELGDKFSSRHGQKGVVGIIVQQEDMPFSESGICPDLIMNPHGFPSRMTVGKMIELLGSKAAVLEGKLKYGTAFGERVGLADSVKSISEVLVRAGYSYSGKDFLTSGTLGTPLEAFIFMGPVYYQKLKHMVVDKMHARAKGPRVVLTRQPTEGRSRDGGLRLGEMERDCLIGYGASNLLLERLMVSSDEFTVHVCEHCGLMGYYDAGRGYAVCPSTKLPDKMAKLQMPYACKLLFQELQAMNIVPRITLSEA
eukprot:jgi/Botrbrau1/18455/Bobra.0072s0038.1